MIRKIVFINLYYWMKERLAWLMLFSFELGVGSLGTGYSCSSGHLGAARLPWSRIAYSNYESGSSASFRSAYAATSVSTHNYVLRNVLHSPALHLDRLDGILHMRIDATGALAANQTSIRLVV
jgi:hypothetical protein